MARAKTAVSHNYDHKKRNVEKDCSVYLRAAFIRGWRLILFLLVPAAFIRGWRLFEGGVYLREAFIRIITVTLILKNVPNLFCSN